MGCPTEVALLGYLRAGGEKHPEVTDHVAACGSCEQLLVGFAELSASRGPGSVEPGPDDDGLPAPGELLGRYVLRSTIGRGAMGIVYRAHDPKLDRDVALKLLLDPQRSALDEARMLLEARAAARVHDPRLVSVYDVGAWNGRVFLAMEYVDGPTLTHWLAESRGVNAIVDVFVAVARGLAIAHEAGLIHCDIKPDNILIGPSGAKLGDFGLAVGPDHAGATGVRGTPIYMAPDLMGGVLPSAASDQFALCVSLFEAIAGVRPARPPTRPPRMPRWLYRVVARGLSTDPARRFASVAEMADVLENRRHRWGRRRVVMGAALAAACTIVITALATTRDRDNDPCPASRADLAQVWNTARGVELISALGPSDGQRARQRLDGYATAWLAAGVSVCRATRVDGRYSEAVLDRRTQCLDRARSRFAALIDLLRDRQPTSHDHALTAIDNLPEIAACDDIAALATQDLPESPAMKAQLEIANSRLDIAMTQIELHRPDAALAQLRYDHATIALVTTESRGRLLEANEQYTTGLALEQLDRTNDAVEAFERAYQAARAARRESIEVKIALQLSGMLGREPATREIARTWLGRARAVADRLDDPSLAALVAEREGSLAFASNDYATALRAFRVVVDLRARYYGDADLRTAISRSSLAIALNKTGMFDESRDEFRRAMTSLVAARGDGHPSLVNMWSGLASLELAVGNVTEAHDAFVEARRRAVLSYGESHSTVIGLDINLATVARRENKLDQAKTRFQNAIDALEKTGHRGSASWRTARQGLAAVLLDQKDFTSARAMIEALIAERLADKATEPVAIASLRIDLGTALTGLHLGEQADAEFVSARRAYVDAFGEQNPRVAHVDLQRAGNAFANHEPARAAQLASPLWARDDLHPAVRAAAGWILAQLVAATSPVRARELASAAANLATEGDDPKLFGEITKWLAR